MNLASSTIEVANVHVQLCTYNDFYAARVEKALDPLKGITGPLADFAGRHFVLASGVFHSRDLGTAQVRLTGPRSHPVLAIVPEIPLRAIVRKILSQLGRLVVLLGC